jgi:hypothetical protein
MDKTESRRRLYRHFLALLCSAGFLTIVPIALYGGLIVWSGDLGGPLNLVIIPVVSATIGFLISLVVFVPLSLLAESSTLQRWQYMVGASLVALAGVVVLAWIRVGSIKPQNRVLLVVGSVCLYFVGGFFVYLCCLAVCRRIWPPRPSPESPTPLGS